MKPVSASRLRELTDPYELAQAGVQELERVVHELIAARAECRSGEHPVTIVSPPCERPLYTRHLAGGGTEDVYCTPQVPCSICIGGMAGHLFDAWCGHFDWSPHPEWIGVLAVNLALGALLTSAAERALEGA